jgi:hypothetical protein
MTEHTGHAGPSVETEAIMKFFAYGHLKPEFQAISKPFGDLAMWIVATLPRNAERTVALRKLLEAKDAGVRASLP